MQVFEESKSRHVYISYVYDKNSLKTAHQKIDL